MILLLMSLIGGYWAAAQFGSAVLLKIVVASGGIATILGLYNLATGHTLSFYDSSFIFLIGVAATLVLYSAVDIGVARFPFLFATALVIVFSLRRGTIIAVAIAVLVTGLVKGRRGFGTAAATLAGVIIATEVVVPGLIFNNLASLVTYFSGGSGNDFSVNYRKFETANAWLNVKEHLVGGLGPTTDWTLYRTYGGRFVPYDRDYIHNSYFWMWLRFGIVGLVAYVLFFIVSVATLIRRSAPTAAVVIGSSMIGLTFAVATAAFLTTTVRWPLLVGLLVGIGLQCRSESPETAVT